VLNVISHRPEDASAVTTALIEHPAIRKVNFTGSTVVGRIIAQLAAKHLKPVLLELGGKAPAIVCADADLKLAAKACTIGAFMHSGQVCMATERIIVHKSIANDFEIELKAAIDQIFPASGDALVLVNTKGVEKNRGLLADAVSKGAEVVHGDVVAKESSDNRMRPVVIKGLNKGMDLYYAESFGPSVALFEFESEEEALEIANDTEYGLTSAVFTESLQTGLRLARGIESGAVHINAMSIHDEPGLPHGGVKGSGWGRFGSVGLGEWLKTKTVTFAN
jgi:acyl-CoA reductase-like NAD-dependent aldehyde dehydrogenase